MEIQGEKLLPTDRDTVWRALNDPAVLQRCLPGCDSFEPDGENRYRVAMQATVGPVRARFTGKLELRDVTPPTSYAMSFEGSGGVAGFGKGTAQVSLSDVAGGTRLSYTSQAQVGGRLAQVGARLIDGVTRRMADDFFTRFERSLAQAPSNAPTRPVNAPAPSSVSAPHSPPVAPQPLPGSTPSAAYGPAPSHGRDGSFAVLAAAVSAAAAAVAVLAAAVAILATR